MSADLTPPPIFSGRVSHALDSKNRVTIPARWRHTDADEFFVMPDPTETFLRVMPPTQFRAVADQVANDPAVTPKDRAVFKRLFYSGSVQVFADKQGRMLVPDEFCELLDLKGELMFVGVHDQFEVWNKKRWEDTHGTQKTIYTRVAELAGL
jgi:MraZ protein